MTKQLALLIATIAVIATTGCAKQRYEAIERRQDGVDKRYDDRMDRRELRSNRADERYDR